MKRILSDQGLSAFLAKSQQDPDAALLVSDLTIQLGLVVSFSTLRHSLLSVPNLTDLVLILSAHVPTILLDNIVFESLVFFKTNLPHASLVVFLSNHPTLTTLSLNSCARDSTAVCPLTTVDLTHVLTIECPTGCVKGASHSNLRRLTMQGSSFHANTPAILRSLTVALVSLVNLTLDFHPDDHDILERVITAAPRVQSLQLIERASRSVSVSTNRSHSKLT